MWLCLRGNGLLLLVFTNQDDIVGSCFAQTAHVKSGPEIIWPECRETRHFA